MGRVTNLAREMIDTMTMGKKPIINELVVKHGYTPRKNSSLASIRKTKEFQKAVKPFVELLEAERLRQFDAMIKKDLNTIEYTDLVDSLDKITKNIQLLKGRATENIRAIILPVDINSKYGTKIDASPELNSSGQAQISGDKLWTPFRENDPIDLRDGGESGLQE